MPSGGGGQTPPKRRGWVIGIVVAIVVATGLFGVVRLRSPSNAGTSNGAPAQTMNAAVDYVVAAPAGPNGACLAGYEWRLATPDDHVCVLPQEHAQVVADNAEAALRRAPGGAYGSLTCKTGYVWREARPGDSVCVVPDGRTRALQENALAAVRRVQVGGPKP